MNIIILILLSFTSLSQIMNNLEIKNNLIMDSKTASTALILDAQKRLVSSTVTSTELAYLVGVTGDIQTQINTKANDNAVVKLTGDQSISGKKTFSQYEAVSTTLASKPCPSMTQAQRDLLTPSSGDCVYNSTTNEQNTYNGSQWARYGVNVVAIYTQTSGQALSGNTTMSFNVQERDTHNIYDSTTQRFFAPIAGYYAIDSSLGAQRTWAANDVLQILLQEFDSGGTYVRDFTIGLYRIYNTNSSTHVVRATAIIYLEQGQSFRVRVNVSGDPNITTNPVYNRLSFIKVSN